MQDVIRGIFNFQYLHWQSSKANSCSMNGTGIHALVDKMTETAPAKNDDDLFKLQTLFEIASSELSDLFIITKRVI